MKVRFRIPQGGGGIVQGMASAELKSELASWEEQYSNTHILGIDRMGWYWSVEFTSTRSLVLFLTTFKPKRDHWWRHARLTG